MIPELGLFLLGLAACLSLFAPVSVFYGMRTHNSYLEDFWKPVVWLTFFSLTGSIVCLLYAFLTDDFSVAYVANHSNTSLEVFYKISALWGSHEGSMLVWIWLISLWQLVGSFTAKDDEDFRSGMQGTMMAIIGLLCLFLLLTSNPFERILPLVPPEGKDLNPILQDIGMIFHPPMLFMGYAGLTFCFAATVSILLGKIFTKRRIDLLLCYSCWTWVFLTGGNVLGSWWAYNELGWGGWWFWDPVENSSFVPWLLVTAQIHALLLARWKNQLLKTSLFLCLCAYATSLLGSFIVRSGVIQSVHAFASDPNRGVFLLVISVLILLPAVILFSTRSGEICKVKEEPIFTQDIIVTLGTWLVAAAALCVLVGTLYPLFYETMGWGTLSVGAPYFNTIFAPMTILAAVLIGAAQFSNSKRLSLLAALVFSIVIALSVALLTDCNDPIMTGGGVFAAAWILISGIRYGFVAHRNWFALIAHLGIAVSIMGVVGDTQYQQEALVRMGPGQGRPLGDVIFVYDETKKVDHKSYYADEGQVFILDKDENEIGLLQPQRQVFKSNGMEMTAAGISHGFFRDLYVSMGNKLSNDEYLVRLAIKPLVSWIWIGGLIMILGAFIGGLVRRFSRRKSNVC